DQWFLFPRSPPGGPEPCRQASWRRRISDPPGEALAIAVVKPGADICDPALDCVVGEAKPVSSRRRGRDPGPGNEHAVAKLHPLRRARQWQQCLDVLRELLEGAQAE